MRHARTMTAALALCAAAAAPAGAFHMGLGNAVASQGAKLAEEAGIPSCGGRTSLFTQAPVTAASLIALEPLGHVFPSGHTFPSDHLYFLHSSAGALAAAPLYAPSNGWVVRISRVDHLTGTPWTEYMLAFSPCAEVKLNFLDVASLSPALLAQASGFDNCQTSSTGGETSLTCNKNLLLPVRAGEVLAYGAGDYGPLEDSRTGISGFASPSRHDLKRGLCPLNYFVPEAKASQEALLGVNNGAVLVPRTAPPVCGTIMQDIPGTAQGDWYKPGSPDSPEDPHLALIHDNVSPSTAVFSVGTSGPGPTGAAHVFPKAVADGTRINYDFNLVTDNQVYCHEGFYWGARAMGLIPALTGRIFLLQLQDASTLRVEMQGAGAATCAGAAPWAFTAGSIVFQR